MFVYSVNEPVKSLLFHFVKDIVSEIMMTPVNCMTNYRNLVNIMCDISQAKDTVALIEVHFKHMLIIFFQDYRSKGYLKFQL